MNKRKIVDPPVVIKILRVFSVKLRENILASTIPLNMISPSSSVFWEIRGKHNTRIKRHASSIKLFLRRRLGGILRCSHIMRLPIPCLWDQEDDKQPYHYRSLSPVNQRKRRFVDHKSSPVTALRSLNIHQVRLDPAKHITYGHLLDNLNP